MAQRDNSALARDIYNKAVTRGVTEAEKKSVLEQLILLLNGTSGEEKDYVRGIIEKAQSLGSSGNPSGVITPLNVLTPSDNNANDEQLRKAAEAAARLAGGAVGGGNGETSGTLGVSGSTSGTVSATTTAEAIARAEEAARRLLASPTPDETRSRVLAATALTPATVGQAPATAAPVQRSSTDLQNEYTRLTGKSPLAAAGGTLGSAGTYTAEYQEFLKQKEVEYQKSLADRNAQLSALSEGWGYTDINGNRVDVSVAVKNGQLQPGYEYGPTRSIHGRPSNLQPGDYWRDELGNLREYGGLKVQEGITATLRDANGKIIEQGAYDPLATRRDGTGGWGGTGRTHMASEASVAAAGLPPGTQISVGALEQLLALTRDSNKGQLTQENIDFINKINKDLLGAGAPQITLKDVLAMQTRAESNAQSAKIAKQLQETYAEIAKKDTPVGAPPAGDMPPPPPKDSSGNYIGGYTPPQTGTTVDLSGLPPTTSGITMPAPTQVSGTAISQVENLGVNIGGVM